MFNIQKETRDFFALPVYNMKQRIVMKAIIHHHERAAAPHGQGFMTESHRDTRRLLIRNRIDVGRLRQQSFRRCRSQDCGKKN
jgi:hypothetical protein